MATKRINKAKEEIAAEMKRKAEIEHQKKLVRAMFPILDSVESIYDAQTVVNALSGFIKADMEDKLSQLKVSDMEIDLKKEEDGPIKTAILELQELFSKEGAEDASKLLERFGAMLSQFSSREYMKNPMTSIKPDDFIA
jgi:hypothetical protein